MGKDLDFYILFVPIMLFSLSFHEFAHALSAYWRGDDTASLAGRITLNPLKHIDPLGLVAFFLIGLGWAKPVPINPLRFKNFRWDTALVSFSGPLSNILLVAFFALPLRFFWGTIIHLEPELAKILIRFLVIGAQLNAALAFFNLIPVPPLDGSHILTSFLPASALEKYESFARYGLLIILFFLFFGGFLKYIIGVPMQILLQLFWGKALTVEIFRMIRIF